jgi:hypothetical protein
MDARLAMLRVFGIAVSLAGCSGGAKGSAADGGDPCAPYHRYPCSTPSPTGLCDANGDPAPALTPIERQYVLDHCIHDG